jgi:hypothetical protein
MVRERTPARTRSKPQLGDSWVVDSDGDDEYTPPPAATSTPPTDGARRRSREPHSTPRRTSSRVTVKASGKPELIMPSIHESSRSSSSLEERQKAERETSWISSKVERGQSASHYPTSNRTPQKAAEASDIFLGFLTSFFRWILDVFGRALILSKTPIAYVIAGYFLVGLFVFLRNVFFTSIYSALSPVCRIPGSSFLNLPMCQSPISVQYSGDEPPPVQFDQLMTVQNKFEEVLQESAGGVSLPLDMKRGETSIRDLRQVVRFSQLHSKNELVLEFDGFVETARITSYDLQKFNSHVSRGVDNILATARWTKRVLAGIAEHDASQGAISSFINAKLLAPFQPIKFTEDALLDQYLQHTRVVEDEVNRLVVEAQALLLVLQNLEDRLDVIHGIAVRDNLHAQGGRNEVLSQLWTTLGGNRSKLGKFNSQLRLLDQVNTYRQNAIAHVSGTLIRLQGMGAELEELRERVGGVELLGGRGSVPLSLHIENIELGVERLERGRKGAKELENEELRKTLDKGRGNDRMIEGT